MRSWLEKNNWLQGCFVDPKDIPLLSDLFPFIPEGDFYLLVASQSCDVSASSEIEDTIEFSIAKTIPTINGNYSHNKHPRRLHIKAHQKGTPITEAYFELIASEKFQLSKNDIAAIREISPYQNLALDTSTIEQYANWLAARYNRPALPTAFEKRLNEQWQKRKREKKSAQLNEHILGIYVDISSFEELETEPYDLSLLLLITFEASNDSTIKKNITELAKEYDTAMKNAGMNVIATHIKTEREISVASFKNYQRFYLDSLSYQRNTVAPVVHA